MATLKRQFITDETGNPIGVILPLAEYVLVKDVLDQYTQSLSETDALDRMTQAAQDPLFMVDLQETMSAFSKTDREWWEPSG